MDYEAKWEELTTPIILDVKDQFGDFALFYEVKQLLDKYDHDLVCYRCPLSGDLRNMYYRRTISKAMAQALVMLVRGRGTVHPRAVCDFTKLRHWDLIQLDEEQEHWRPTDLGVNFVNGHASVPKYAVIVNNRFVDNYGDQVYCHQILEK